MCFLGVALELQISRFNRVFSDSVFGRTMSSEPQNKKTKVMASSLDQLKAMTTIVADTGDFEGKWMSFTVYSPLFDLWTHVMCIYI